MAILNALINGMVEKLAEEAMQFTTEKNKTLSAKNLEAAVRVLIRGEGYAKYAIEAGT